MQRSMRAKAGSSRCPKAPATAAKVLSMPLMEGVFAERAEFSTSAGTKIGPRDSTICRGGARRNSPARRGDPLLDAGPAELRRLRVVHGGARGHEPRRHARHPAVVRGN